MFKKYSLRYYNFRLAAAILATMLFGLLLVNSAKPSYTMKEAIGITGCFAVMIIISFIDYNWILKYFWLIYIVNIALLGAVLVFGHNGKGATRWIKIADGITLQPSEFTKLFLILFMAKVISMFKDRFNTWKFLGILAASLIVPVGMVFAQPDLSTTLLICLIICSVLYCAGIDYKKVLTVLLIMVPIVLALFVYIQTPNQKLLKPYQVNRILAFKNPDAQENEDDRYQQENSVRAIGSGQLTGKGLNNDDPNSVKNAGLIPEAQTDFIFSVIGEELGFVGSIVTVLLLSWIVGECLYAAVRARNFEGRLVCCGAASWIAFQSFINIGVTTLILPNTGLPLPFISYGLSSLMSLAVCMGIILNISLQRNAVDEDAVLDFNK